MARRQIGVTIESMTGSPHGVTPGGSWPPPSGPPPTWPPTPPKQSRALVIASLLIAIVAIAVAIGAWFRPVGNETTSSTPSSQLSEQEVAKSDEAICAAHDFINRATQTAGRQTSDDPAVKAAIAINIRLGSTLSASYLLSQLDLNPATSAELAEAVKNLATAYQITTLTHFSDAPENEIDEAYKQLDSAERQVVEACG